MLFIHAQLSSSVKQAVVICNIVAIFALVQWYDYVCQMFAETYRHILNAEISQFSQRLGAMPPDPHIWDCL